MHCGAPDNCLEGLCPVYMCEGSDDKEHEEFGGVLVCLYCLCKEFVDVSGPSVWGLQKCVLRCCEGAWLHTLKVWSIPLTHGQAMKVMCGAHTLQGKWPNRFNEIEWPVLILLTWVVEWGEYIGIPGLWPESMLAADLYRLRGTPICDHVMAHGGCTNGFWMLLGVVAPLDGVG